MQRAGCVPDAGSVRGGGMSPQPGSVERFAIVRDCRYIAAIAANPSPYFKQGSYVHVSWTDRRNEALTLCTARAAKSMIVALKHHGIKDLAVKEVLV